MKDRIVARGKVKRFSEEKGYGFTEEQDFLVHYTGIVGEGFRTLEEVSVVVEVRRGRKQASRVEAVV